jgi:hypothetical protein
MVVTAVTFCGGMFSAAAQEPSLAQKEQLSTALIAAPRAFSNSSAVDVEKITVVTPPDTGSYTLEVKARVTSSQGRGLDVEARNAQGIGFRTSATAGELAWSAPLSAMTQLVQTNNSAEQTFRYAVTNGVVHIYQNGYYIATKSLAPIYDVVNDVEVDPFERGDQNAIEGWAGTEGNNSGAPTDYGWTTTGGAPPFSVANGTSGVRYIDITEGHTDDKYTLDGEKYRGRIMFLRWDGSGYSAAKYIYPVTLEANATYMFSMLHAYWSNSTGGKTITAGVSQSSDGSDAIASQTFTSTNQGVLHRADFTFTTAQAGQYYLTFSGTWGLFSVAELQLHKIAAEPHFLFGKNYAAGSVNMELTAASFDASGAFAPATKSDNPPTGVSISNAGVVAYPSLLNLSVTVSGKTSLHLTGATPLTNSSVDLASDSSWLFFDNVKPSLVISRWLSKVSVNGAEANNGQNVRVDIYGAGAVVIPNGVAAASGALEVFTKPNFGGSSKKYGVNTYNTGLDTLNNAIRSFKLKHGYMATLANNTDGTGYSRVFIADSGDLEVSAMPKGLDATVSYIRVFRWKWVSKKGWCQTGGSAQGNTDLVNGTWFYSWSADQNSATNQEYVPIKQQRYWPGFSEIYGKANVTHLLGYNEPDHTEQSNVSVETAISEWPEMMKSGMRLGAPAVTNNSWLYSFMEECDKRNYRVDYIAYHAYWGGKSPQNWYNDLKAIYTRTGRKIWLTEWNNGANWTTEGGWPDSDKSYTTANAQKQLNDLKAILQVLDTAGFIERYSIYNWVQDARAIILNGKLTLAGEYYAANPSQLAFTGEYRHEWKLVEPPATYSLSNNNTKATVRWDDLNGETGRGYLVERSVDSAAFEVVGYAAGSATDSRVTLSFVDESLPAFRSLSYRLEPVGRDTAPFLAASGSGKVTLTWDFVSYAGCNLMRSTAADGEPEREYEVIAESVKNSRYVDTALTNGQTYYYKIVDPSGGKQDSPVRIAVPTAGQHLHLGFDENSGEVAYDDWGGFHATLKNAAAWTAGKNTPAVTLDDGNRAYVQLGDGVVSELNDFTIAAWLKLPENLASNARIFDFGNGTGSFMTLIPYLSGGKIRYKITADNSDASKTFTAEFERDIPRNEWVHIAIAQASDSLKLYLNGELAGTEVNANRVNPSDLGRTSLNYLGRSQWSSDPYASLSCDDFRIYSEALSGQDIAALSPPPVEVAVKVEAVSLSATRCELEVGDTLRLLAFVEPDSAANKRIAWSSSNSLVASVDTAGLVTALAAGVAIVTVTTEDGAKTDSCEVTVVEKVATAAATLNSAAIWVYVENGALVVSSPVAETIEVYSTLGSRIYTGKKQAGIDKINIIRLPNQLLIVRGNSGWTRKVMGI